MRTDTKKFKKAVAVAIRKSRKKWNPIKKKLAYADDPCGFCEKAGEGVDCGRVVWEGCGECGELFWDKVGAKKGCIQGIDEFCGSKDGISWKRACTIMNKRFDKIAEIYGVDA